MLFRSITSCKKEKASSKIIDVYVAGGEHNGTKDNAKIWKNGVATNLTKIKMPKQIQYLYKVMTYMWQDLRIMEQRISLKSVKME